MAVKKLSHILGLNARNHVFSSIHNSNRSKKIADSKLLTKSVLRKTKIPTPRLFKVFKREEEIGQYDFLKLPDSFVVKPNNGMGGEGIMVIEGRGEVEGEWITSKNEVVSIRDIQLHVGDILGGSFSMFDTPDTALIEERVRIHPVFEKYTYHGTPDIRVVVFNRVPVMAMLRIPTRESGGRANLYQGAVGAGIDLASGVTTHAICHNEEIKFIPGTRRLVRGIQIPEWNKVLEVAIRCQEVTKLGYLGADIVLQPSIKHPGKTLVKVLELNAQPGLKIQLCNQAGLRLRLEKIDDLEIESVEKGIKVAKELFGDRTLAHIGKGVKTIGVFEKVEVVDDKGERVEVKAKVDTGAFRSSIDKELAERLNLLHPENILFQGGYKSALGRSDRPVIGITFYLAGRKIKTTANVADRSNLKRSMLIGRRDLGNFAVVTGGSNL